MEDLHGLFSIKKYLKGFSGPYSVKNHYCVDPLFYAHHERGLSEEYYGPFQGSSEELYGLIW